MRSAPPKPRLLIVGPMPTEGHYNGGIAILLKRLVEQWSIPFEPVVYNLNTVPRNYGSVNRINVANVRRFGLAAWGLMRIARSKRPELAYLHTSRHMAMVKDMVLARLLRWSCGCKLVLHVHHATERTLFMGGSSFLRRMQLRFVLGSADSVVLMCESIRAQLELMLPKRQRPAFRDKARVLYNFTDLPPVQPHRSHEPIRVFFIGNVGQAKGVYELVAAVGLLKSKGIKIEAALAGPFDSKLEEERLKEAVSKLDVVREIDFPGVVSGLQKEKLFRSADIFVLPSHAEGVPISMLEAMSYCIPVVATNVGGIPEIMAETGAGILVPPKDINQLAEAIGVLAGSPEIRKRCGEAGRRAVGKHHTIEAFLSGLSSIFSRLERAPGHPQPVTSNVPREVRP